MYLKVCLLAGLLALLRLTFTGTSRDNLVDRVTKEANDGKHHGGNRSMLDVGWTKKKLKGQSAGN